MTKEENKRITFIHFNEIKMQTSFSLISHLVIDSAVERPTGNENGVHCKQKMVRFGFNIETKGLYKMQFSANSLLVIFITDFFGLFQQNISRKIDYKHYSLISEQLKEIPILDLIGSFVEHTLYRTWRRFLGK